MSSQEMQQLLLGFMSELCQDGKKKGKLKRLKPPQVKEDMTLSPMRINFNLQVELPLFTPVSAVEDNKKISQDKQILSEKNIQKPKSLVKLGEDSISKGRNFLPYWNELCQEMSNALWSHIKIASPDLDLTGSNGSVNSLSVKSWFSMRQFCLHQKKWLKTSSPSSTVSLADSMDSENIKLRSKKIRIYPSQELKLVWNQWISGCRYCYNQAIAYQKQHGRIPRGKLRNIIMQSDLPEWVKATPCHIRQNAIFDAHQAYVASKDCKFRSCKSPRQTIKFNNSNYSQGRWYPRITKGLSFKVSESIPLSSPNATQLIKTRNGEWYGVFLFPVETTNSPKDRILAIDPGVRTFITGFDGSEFIEIGKGDMGRINGLCSHLDDLMSRISKEKGKKKAKMRKAAHRLRNKIRNLIDECHKQTAHYLVNNYGMILLPTFETSQMTKKKKRKIRTKTARNMLTWSHYRFKQVLKNKAELNGCQVIDVTEEFTSKTCTKCGHIHSSLGGSKIFKCPECGHTILRDYNGALGIMLKALSDTTFTISFDGDAIVAQYGNIPCCSA
jgi:putative transposase